MVIREIDNLMWTWGTLWYWNFLQILYVFSYHNIYNTVVIFIIFENSSQNLMEPLLLYHFKDSASAALSSESSSIWKRKGSESFWVSLPDYNWMRIQVKRLEDKIKLRSASVPSNWADHQLLPLLWFCGCTFLGYFSPISLR